MTGASIELTIFIAAGCLTSFCAGAIVTYLAVHWGIDRQAEVDRVRKDTAVEAALETAFQLQRVSGEQPAVELIEVPAFMADSGYRPPQVERIGHVGESPQVNQVEHVCTYECAGQGCNEPPSRRCPFDGRPHPDRCEPGCTWTRDQAGDYLAEFEDSYSADPPTTARVLPDQTVRGWDKSDARNRRLD